MKCKNCGYDLAFGVKYCAHCGSQVEIIENKDNDLSKYSKYSLLSFIMAMIPIALITICYLYSGGDTSEAGKGAVFWLVIIYFWTVGIPISIASVVCGIKSLKYKKGILGILGLIIGALPLLAIVLVFASTFISIANS